MWSTRIPAYSTDATDVGPEQAGTGPDRTTSSAHQARVHPYARNLPQNPAARSLQHSLVADVRVQSTIRTLQSRLATLGNSLHPDRFKGAPAELPTLDWSAHTAISVDGQECRAHRILFRDRFGNFGPRPVAAACAYPEATAIERHLKMLFQERPSVLVVLARDDERRTGARGYYRPGRTFPTGAARSDDALTVTSRATGEYKGENGYSMDVAHFEMTLTRRLNGRVVDVTIPVVHMGSWPDETALDQERLKLLLNEIRRVEQHAPHEGAERCMMVHCKEGVGRTGQLIGTRIMQDYGNRHVFSVEGIIRAMRQSRSIHMAYAPAQQRALVEAGAELGIAPLEPEGTNLASVLDHIGIPRVFGMDDYRFCDVIETLRMHAASIRTDTAAAAGAFDSIAGHSCPLLITASKDDGVVSQVLWSTPNSENGKNLGDGDIDPRHPRAYLQAQAGAANIDTIALTLLKPGKDIGMLALYSGLPLARFQCDLLGPGGADKLKESQEIEGFCAWVEKNDIEAYQIDMTVSTFAEALPRVWQQLHQSSSAMVEFRDHSIEGVSITRLVLGRGEQPGIVARFCTDEGDIRTEASFATPEALGAYIAERNPLVNEFGQAPVISLVGDGNLLSLEDLAAYGRSRSPEETDEE